MIDLINRIYVYKGLALLIFTAILTNMFFSQGPGILRTQPVRGYALTTNNTSRIYLPIIIRAAGGPVVSPTPEPTLRPTPTSTPPTPPSNYTEALFLNTSAKTNNPSTAVDASGGFHFAYNTYTVDNSGHRPAYYAYCAVNCGSQANWGRVSLSDNIYEVQLALTTSGHPRLLLMGDDPSYNKQYQYAACDTNCTQSANWQITVITTSTYIPVYIKDYALHYFALDSQDRPRFVYRKDRSVDDAFYVFCDTSCTDTVNWWEYPIDPMIFSDPTTQPMLAFTSTGQPRIAASVFPVAGGYLPAMLEYFTCDTACDNPAQWSHAELIEMGSGHSSMVLRLDSNDQPRMVFNQGFLDSGNGEYLYYLWCDTGCADSANWGGSTIGLSQGQAEDPDLALDALDHPRIAFRNISPDGLGYSWCDTNCESDGATWESGLAESSDALEAEWPILPPTSCTTSYWYGGNRSSLALDTAGNPRIGYVGQHLHAGGCIAKEDYRAVRFVFFDRP